MMSENKYCAYCEKETTPHVVGLQGETCSICDQEYPGCFICCEMFSGDEWNDRIEEKDEDEIFYYYHASCLAKTPINGAPKQYLRIIELRRAFVAGARWWDFAKTHKWRSDVSLFEAQAEITYPGINAAELDETKSFGRQ